MDLPEGTMDLHRSHLRPSRSLVVALPQDVTDHGLVALGAHLGLPAGVQGTGAPAKSAKVGGICGHGYQS